MEKVSGSLIMDQIRVENCRDILDNPVKKIVFCSDRFPNMQSIVYVKAESFKEFFLSQINSGMA